MNAATSANRAGDTWDLNDAGIVEAATNELVLLCAATVWEEGNSVMWLHVMPPIDSDEARMAQERKRFHAFPLMGWEPTYRLEGECPQAIRDPNSPEHRIPCPQMLSLLVRLGWAEAHWDDEGIQWLVRPTDRGIELFKVAVYGL